MPRLRYLESAHTDLRSILEYVARESGSIPVAKAFTASLRERCRHLASLPGTMGRARPELPSGIRSVAFGNYVIFFRYVEDRFEVINILERHRDIDSFFQL